jgi:hypothetical protein
VTTTKVLEVATMTFSIIADDVRFQDAAKLISTTDKRRRAVLRISAEPSPL